MTGLNSNFLSRSALEALGFARIGDDVLVHSTAVIVDCASLSLGSHVRIDPFVIISNRGGVAFGDHVHVGAHSALSGQGEICFADFVNVSHHVGIFTSTDDFSGRTLSHPMVRDFATGVRTASIRFDRHACVGTGSVVLPGADFGEGAVLGAMSMTSKPLEPWTIYVGQPARVLKKRMRDVLEREREYREISNAGGTSVD